MNSFFRFPHTPHIAWMGKKGPRDDKVLSTREAENLLKGAVIVEEKLDGANIGFSRGENGRIKVQNRGQYLEPPFHGQFSRLASWLAMHEERLLSELDDRLILFGEWCTTRHSIGYSHLPDWLVAFDVYDRKEERFWSTTRRNALVTRNELVSVPILFSGNTTMQKLQQLVAMTPSAFAQGPMEGVVIRQEDSDWLQSRTKLVRPDFTQAITEHWSRGPIYLNQLGPTSAYTQTKQ